MSPDSPIISASLLQSPQQQLVQMTPQHFWMDYSQKILALPGERYKPAQVIEASTTQKTLRISFNTEKGKGTEFASISPYQV